TKNRTGEDRNIPFRTDRYFCSNGEWYFLTRGGGQQGPFSSKADMEGELMLYLREQNLAKNAISS
ncbi:MAG: DUF6316 family protein, partial [Gammaproteobacteria bacterium]|nr:DUF6316 family protein [Gammaproteobacteria bacterium]